MQFKQKYRYIFKKVSKGGAIKIEILLKKTVMPMDTE